MATELVYNVYFEDFNNRSIVVRNVFDHQSFLKMLYNVKKNCGDNFTLFSEKVKCALQYCFWSKSEYEVVITSWPPYVESEEIDRLSKEKEERLKSNNDSFRRSTVRLTIGEKVDIYDQVMLNWDLFIRYVWENRKLIKKI